MSRNIKVKPGKGQSAMGLIVGIIFCLIGLFAAIPAMGIFGFIWTGIAVVITIVNGINAFSDTGVPTHEIVIEEEVPTGNTPLSVQKSSVEERLRMVDRLYAEGTITKEEHEQKRKKILDEI